MKPLIATLLLLLTATCSIPRGTGHVPVKNNPDTSLLPAVQDERYLLHRVGYTLEYAEAHEQARWVAYWTCRAHMEGTWPRCDHFRFDPDVISGSAMREDYKGSGYDRGHLCPAGDMKWDSLAMCQTFLLSNMSPQLHAFNDGVWKRCEEQVRAWAREYDSLYVVTGPLLRPGLPAIGESQVSVPEAYYKIVYDPHRQEAIALLVPHAASKKSVKSFVVSIDSVETVTGIDFFPALPDSLEASLEAQIRPYRWTW